MNTLVYELEYIPVQSTGLGVSQNDKLLPIALISNQLLSILAKETRMNSNIKIYISSVSTETKTVLLIVRNELIIGRLFITVNKIQSEIIQRLERISDLIEQQIKRDIKNN